MCTLQNIILHECSLKIAIVYIGAQLEIDLPTLAKLKSKRSLW